MRGPCNTNPVEEVQELIDRGVQPARLELITRRLKISRVARDLQVHEVHLGGVLNGRRKPSQGLCLRLADYLDMPPEDLFTDNPSSGVTRNDP